jgi:putative transposase
VAIQAAQVRPRQTSGPERLQAERREDGLPAGIGRIKRLRKKRGLRCTPVRRFTITTDSSHRRPVVDTRLAQRCTTTRPTEPWGTAITDVPTAEGGLYLAGIKDLFTGEVGGQARGARLTTDVVSHAFRNAVGTTRPRPGVIHHSDRGAQYGAQDYQEHPRQFGMTASMSRKGNG